MCGRFVAKSPVPEIVDRFEIDEVRAQELFPSYNVAPTREVYVVTESEGVRLLESIRWGLIPFWSKSLGEAHEIINAKAETIAEKPAFKRSFAKRRCLIPADGFYEWKKPESGKGAKTPYYIGAADGELLALAGIWDLWRDPANPDAEPLRTCAIITTEPTELVGPIHDRMPAILAPGDWGTWLEQEVSDLGALQALLLAPCQVELSACPVSTAVNRVGNDSPDLIEPLTARS